MRVAVAYRLPASVVAGWSAADVLLAAVWLGRTAAESGFVAQMASIDAGHVSAVAFHEPNKLTDLRREVERARPSWLEPVRPREAPAGWEAAFADVPLTNEGAA